MTHNPSLVLSGRFLLGFGQVSYYLGYNALSNYFPTECMLPNTECRNQACRDRQAQYAGAGWKPQVRKRC